MALELIASDKLLLSVEVPDHKINDEHYLRVTRQKEVKVCVVLLILL